jgi:hypothetical protein
MYGFTVHLDQIHIRIGLGAQFGHHHPIEGDPPGVNQFLSFAPGANTGGGQIFL